MEIAAECKGATCSLTGDDGAECFVGVDAFKYLGQVLHWKNNNWPAVLRNIRRVIQV